MGADGTTLARLAEVAAGSQRVTRTGDARIDDLHADSRTVTPGSVFVAVAGSRIDGHDLVDTAIAAGAVAVVVEREVAASVPRLVVERTRPLLGPLAAEVHRHPARDMAMVAVTGTNGKTTVTHLLAAMADAGGRSPGVIGTIGARLPGSESTEAIGFTTPEAPELQRLLRRMVNAGVDMVAMEVSSHALALGRVDGIVFDVAAFTNLSQDHLDFHGDMDRYFAAKRELFTPERSREAVVVADDPWGRRLLEGITIPATTVGLTVPADLGARDVALTATGGTLTLTGLGGSTVALPLAGGFNARNTLVAIACALRIGLSEGDIVSGLDRVGPVPGRFEHVDAGQGFGVVVDFAHTPEAIEAVIAAAADLTTGRVIAVAGAGGDRDRAKRPLMGAALATADLAVVTSDNPRSEDPDAIIAQVVSGLPTSAEVVVEPDRRRAIAVAVAAADPGDLVLILGKGHETGQEAGGETSPFDDRVVAAAELAALGEGRRSR